MELRFMDNSSENKFRFTSKEEYEDALKELLRSEKKVKKINIKKKKEDEYETLIDEYLRFCSLGKDA